MLKETEEFVERRKLSLIEQQHPHHQHQEATDTTTTTPPFTPPSLPLQIMATDTQTETASTSVTTAATTPPTKLTSTTMAATLLANAAAAAAIAANSIAANAAVTPSLLPATGPGLQDHYSLRWNNHQNHILRAFDALLQSKALVDVTLVCAETSIHAHKIVLSACSPFFQRVFAETPCKHPVIVLKDFRGWVVQAIVDFMYRGEISVPQERLQTLIQAGESLQVRGLVESSIPEHTPTPAASPDDFGLIDASLMSSELERCSSFDEESPSMVSAGSKLILPSRLFGSSGRRERKRDRERDRERERDRQQERERDRDRERERERDLERDLEREMESDQELNNESGTHSDLCTSPMPRRKQARPRRRSGELPHDLSASKSSSPTPLPSLPPLSSSLNTPSHLSLNEDSKKSPLKTVIKSELNDPALEDMDEPNEHDSGNGNDSSEPNDSHEKINSFNDLQIEDPSHRLNRSNSNHMDDEDLDEGKNFPDDTDDMDELLNSSTDLRIKSQACIAEGPEDLCTTNKDKSMRGRRHSLSDGDSSNNNNNNNSKLNNNNRIVLSLKDIRQLNKPSSSSTPNPSNNLNPFTAASLREMRLDRSEQCKMEAFEAQMHAAAAAAAAAAANGENPFQHMEHQMDLSLAAAAAAAAASRERDQAMHRDQRDLPHNAYANSLLSQMGMQSFGPGPGGNPNGPGNNPGQSAHERLEESMKCLTKDFTPGSPMNLPTHFNPPDGPPHPPSPLSFPGMSSALTLTPPHMFGLDSPLGLFPPGIDPGKLYNPLMDMSDPRGIPGETPPFLKKKMPRPKGQHSAPRGGPPRSWTNAELTEALQHVWNKKMTTSQASRIFGIPYNSLLMYVRGKYGKSLKLEQLRKDCISGPPLELLQMGMSSSSNGKKENENSEKKESREKKEARIHSNPDFDMGPTSGSSGPGGSRSASSEPDLLGGPNSIFNPFQQGFYPDFGGGFPGLPLSMLNLLPPSERHQHGAGGLHHLNMDEDCKSDRSKHSSTMDEEFNNAMGQPLALNNRDDPNKRSNNDLLGSGNSGNNTAIPQQNGGNGQD